MQLPWSNTPTVESDNSLPTIQVFIGGTNGLGSSLPGKKGNIQGEPEYQELVAILKSLKNKITPKSSETGLKHSAQ